MRAYNIQSLKKVLQLTIQTKQKLSKTSNSTIELNVPNRKDIYIVVTSRSNNQDISISTNKASNVNSSYKILDNEDKNIILTPKSVLDFRNKIKEELNQPIKKDATKNYKLLARSTNENDTQKFYIDTFQSDGSSSTKQINATARKVVKNVSTAYGTKTLVVWVEDDEYNDGSLFSNGRVTQDMVDNLADTFLKAGSKNDIYDWVTNVYGKEWGADAQSKNSRLISDNGYIDILIDDMEHDGIAGYFYAKDNFKSAYKPQSNEKIMFYINSRVYTRSGHTQDENEKEVLTTLAHEFQHMIHFYQRSVLKDNPHPTWLNEMLSETTEDLIATKIDYKGPRNVDPDDGTAGPDGNRGGRYPNFNDNNTLSLTSWSNQLEDYSKVSAFGTFLTRNYNGPKVLHDIEYSSKSGYLAVEDATKVDFKTLLSKWGSAVVLSDNKDLSVNIPRYNFGKFKNVSYNGITYNLGSINFYNYIPEPTFKSSDTLDKNANLYYHLGSVEGKEIVNITIPTGGDITIIAK